MSLLFGYKGCVPHKGNNKDDDEEEPEMMPKKKTYEQGEKKALKTFSSEGCFGSGHGANPHLQKSRRQERSNHENKVVIPCC